MKHWSESLSKLNACTDAVAYCAKFPSLESAWSACERGDWMLWYAGKTSGKVGSSSRLKVVAAAVKCAEIVLPLFEKKYPDDKSVRTCIETTNAYINGVATLNDVKRDRKSAAYAYADAAAAVAADAATYAAVAYAASAAADAASAAAYAAAYVYAAAYAAWESKRKETLKQCADIVRRHYPTPPTSN